MITGRTNTIGVVVADIENVFFARPVRGITDAARAEGFEVALTNTDEDSASERAAMKTLLDKRVDGVIIAPASAHDHDHLDSARRSGFPVTLLDRTLPDLALDTVVADNREAAARVIRRLTAAGHRRIGMVTGADARRRPRGPAASTGADRVAGYLDALREAGVPDHGRYLGGGATGREPAERVTAELLALPDPPTAIFASDSVVAVGALAAVRTAGLRIPADISFVAFDDADWTVVVDHPLSVVAQPAHELGATAVRLLVARIRGAAHPAETRVLPTRFLDRASIGSPS
ncbi:substrate-binding domain-containing protein [Actinophytocola sp.]|uniref:substrate-binding domain-containing protein n=1 Tax=Actinophytocola sp. TaxID=1872138 RepID=UPI003899B1A9